MTENTVRVAGRVPVAGGGPRVALMGGTFDPVHYGHLVTAESARHQFRLEKVIFVPSGNPPHKKDYRVSPARDRYLMTFLAVVSNPCFELSAVEMERPGYSYAVDTVRHFRRLWGQEADLFFITGADAVLEILTWKGVDELLQNCRFIAATRPGYPLGQLEEMIRQLPPAMAGNFHTMEIPSLAISSTDIRQRVREGRPIKYLLPETVEEYIYKNGLYRDEPPRDPGARIV